MAKSNSNDNSFEREVERIVEEGSSVAILLDFKNLPDDETSTFAGKVLYCCDNNAFLVPPKEVTDPLRAAAADYNEKLVKARASNGAGGTTDLKNIAKGVLEVKLTDAAKWVSQNCGGNAAIAKSYGFNTATVERHRAKQLPAPQNVKYKYGMPGTIVFSCKSLGQRVRYIVKCSADGGKTWSICGDSTDSRKIVAEGLERGKGYLFMIYGKNAAGDGMPYFTAEIIAAV